MKLLRHHAGGAPGCCPLAAAGEAEAGQQPPPELLKGMLVRRKTVGHEGRWAQMVGWTVGVHPSRPGGCARLLQLREVRAWCRACLPACLPACLEGAASCVDAWGEKAPVSSLYSGLLSSRPRLGVALLLCCCACYGWAMSRHQVREAVAMSTMLLPAGPCCPPAGPSGEHLHTAEPPACAQGQKGGRGRPGS